MRGSNNNRAAGARPAARQHRGGLSAAPPPAGLTYSAARSPTFTSLEPLRGLLDAQVADHVIQPEQGRTDFEKPDNLALLHQNDSIAAPDSIDQWAKAFDDLILPSVVTPDTRASYYAQWRSVVTFAYITNALEEVLPMSERVLKAWLLQCVLLGYHVATIVSYVSAIKHRHRLWGYDFPVVAADIHDWMLCIRRNRGLPSSSKFKLLPAHLKAAMQLTWSSIAAMRDVLIVVISTVCALRTSEVASLDVCNLSWDHDGPDMLMVRVKHLKNRQGREGLFPRIGAAKHRRFDVLQMLRMYLRWAKLQVSPHCTKKTRPTDPCTACGKLFRVTHPSGNAVQDKGITKTHVASAVRNVLQRIGVDASGYSGISMRKGGVSAAVVGGIPHDLRVMQTGHRSSAWEHYFDLADKAELYRFWSVFQC